MRLIENPIRVNASLRKMIPNTIDYLYGHQAIKYYRKFTLGNTNVFFIDAFNRIDIVMTNTHRRISDEQIQFVIEKLLDKNLSNPKIDHLAKSEIETEVHHKLKINDIVIIEQLLNEEK